MPEVERAVADCKRAGALGARIMGGGFGGSVLALFRPAAPLPERRGQRSSRGLAARLSLTSSCSSSSSTQRAGEADHR